MVVEKFFFKVNVCSYILKVLIVFLDGVNIDVFDVVSFDMVVVFFYCVGVRVIVVVIGNVKG